MPDYSVVPGDCFSSVAASDQTHKFELPKHPVRLRLLLVDAADKPVRGQKWRLANDRLHQNGTTSASGLIEVELPADMTQLTLRLERPKLPKKAKRTNVKPARVYPPPVVETEFIDADEPASAPSDTELVFTLEVGSLPPFDTAAGAVARLQNLGFAVSLGDAADAPSTLRAVRAYERRYQQPDGPLDSIGKDLRRRHDEP